MATIHSTTLVPSKLELLAAWLPVQDWYEGPQGAEFGKAGGFRLDDPRGEVGIEVMFVNAVGLGEARTYQVPMTYRGAPLPGADRGLIGTAVHGVLGLRWIYDGTHDPVFLEQLTRLVCGLTSPQHQSRSDEVDDHVHVRPVADRATVEQVRVQRSLAISSPDTGAGVIASWTAWDGTVITGLVVSAG